MKRLNVSEARRLLPRLLDDLGESLEPLIITRHGKALGKLVPCTEEELHGGRESLPLRGLPMEMAEDFDAPLDGEWEALGP